MKLPAAAPARPPRRSNASVARDFMRLAFQLESGRQLPVLSRFEGPVTLRMTGMRPGGASERDLDALLARLHNEAGIAIRRVGPGQPANITIEFLPQRILRRAVPNAACFVTPGVGSWREFLNRRAPAERDWTALTRRTRITVFIPGDVAPQEIRDCMHEEIAQGLGPVNDLYELRDSIFNDDNFHTVLTGFDMLILRTFYDPALASGMTPDETAARLPAILARINPAGQRIRGPAPMPPTPRAWIKEIESALGRPRAGPQQVAAARRAVQIARDLGWNDNRLGFSLYAFGRLILNRDSRLALAAFSEAEAVFLTTPETRIHTAHVAVQGAAHALSSGNPAETIRIADRHSPVALQAENASLLSTLLMLKAQSLDAMNRSEEARIVRLDALAWARYGMGSPDEIRRRLAEIAALSPRRQRRAPQ